MVCQQASRVGLWQTAAIAACVLGGAAAVCAQADGLEVPPPDEQRTDLPPEPPDDPPAPPAPIKAVPPTPEELTAARRVGFEIHAGGELGFNADLRDEPGNLTVTRLGASLSSAIPVQRFAQLDLGLDYEFSHYRFRDATGFVAGVESPWENVHRETLTATFSQRQTLRLAWFVGGSVGFAHEEGASLSDSLVGAGFGGVRFAVTERFFVGGGLAVWSRLEESPLVVPLPHIDWRITDRTRLTTDSRLGLTIVYDASDDLTFSVGGEYELREFRLDSGGPIAGGVGQERRIPITAAVEYSPTRQLSVTLAGGASLWQQLRLLDSNGSSLARIDARPTPFASLQLTYRF